MNQQIVDAVEILQKHDYIVLEPHQKVTQYHAVGEYGDVSTLYRGKVLDCEANGVHDEAKPFEVGCVAFTYDDEGHIYTVDDVFTMFEDIHEPIMEDVTTVTGRTNADIEGKVFDDEKMAQVYTEPGVTIAHNAQYDRPKLERRFPLLQHVPWGCSLKDVPWMAQKIVNVKLRDLCMDICGFHFHGHYAENDAYALLDVLNADLPTGTVFQALLATARSKTTRLWAIDSPYEKKDLLKSAGFRWSDAPVKAYYLDIQGSLDPMIHWLQDQMYPYPVSPEMFPQATVTALTRHSNRIVPTNHYLRHIFPFGKHRDHLVSEVAHTDKDYLVWCLTSGKMELQDDMRRTLQFYA